MIFPIGVDVSLQRWPIMNWVVMALMVLAYVWQIADPATAERFILNADGAPAGLLSEGVSPFAVQRIDEHPLSILGSMFLHADLAHLAGNLLALWIFGNAVCAKVGNIAYLPLWIAFGIVAVLPDKLFGSVPTLGASGAIAGIAGVFLVYYVLNDVTVFWFFYFRAGTFEIAAYWVVLVNVGFDVLGAASHRGGIDFMAHLVGYGAGFSVGLALLKLGWCKATEQERTVLDLFRRLGAGAHARGDRSVAGSALTPQMLRQRLYVLNQSGEAVPRLVAEIARPGAPEKDLASMLVSDDGQRWTSFAEWRRSFASGP
ncbi:MAG: rhomboid family intramembrane serine protease [Phycisphaerales bacterium]|nr:rhomboid family intramembrane serine protease [Phycisphaerales bacterium]